MFVFCSLLIVSGLFFVVCWLLFGFGCLGFRRSLLVSCCLLSSVCLWVVGVGCSFDVCCWFLFVACDC